MRWISWFSFIHNTDQFSHHNFLKRLLTPLQILCSFVKDYITIYPWLYLWTLYSVPLVWESVLILVLQDLVFYSFIKNWRCEKISLHLLFPRIALDIQSFLLLCIHFWSIISMSLKYAMGIFLGTELNLYISTGRIVILKTLILSIHEEAFYLF